MKLTLFSTKSYDTHYFTTTLTAVQPTIPEPITLTAHPFPLTLSTVPLARNSTAICVFVNDTLPAPVLHALWEAGVRAILLRCAGFNNVDLPAAEALGFFVANVPSYSPEAVAEFAVALLQTLNRKTHRAYNRVREGNFNLEGFLGMTLHNKKVGVVGLGRIGMAFARIMRGFGCEVVGFDPVRQRGFARRQGQGQGQGQLGTGGGEAEAGAGAEAGVEEGPAEAEQDEFTTQLAGRYVGAVADLLAQSDIVSLHCPLTEATKHIVNAESLRGLKRGAILVNTSRGGLIHTRDAIGALKAGTLGGLALDVYEQEGDLFYNDHSAEIIHDDTLMRLMTFPNVLVAGHQAFFTQEALGEIAQVTLSNLADFVGKRPCRNSLVREGHLFVEEDKQPVRL